MSISGMRGAEEKGEPLRLDVPKSWKSTYMGE